MKAVEPPKKWTLDLESPLAKEALDIGVKLYKLPEKAQQVCKVYTKDQLLPKDVKESKTLENGDTVVPVLLNSGYEKAMQEIVDHEMKNGTLGHFVLGYVCARGEGPDWAKAGA